jgi:hypothetical protein
MGHLLERDTLFEFPVTLFTEKNHAAIVLPTVYPTGKKVMARSWLPLATLGAVALTCLLLFCHGSLAGLG